MIWLPIGTEGEGRRRGNRAMGNKEWPDDWRVGNGSARVGLGCILVPLLIVVAALLLR